MSATGHEWRRRRQAAQRVMDALKGRDLKAFVKDENLPCEPNREALAQYMPRYDRVALQAMVERLERSTSQAAPKPAPEPQDAVFDLSGNWMQARAQVRDALGMEKVPGNKAEAAEALRAAGYQVKE